MDNISKKESRNAYKQMKLRHGIFQIKNLQNGRLFLQSTADLDRAYNSDLFQLKAGLHLNKELQNDWNKLGKEQFEFSILDEMKVKENETELQSKRDLKELLIMHRNDFSQKGTPLY